MLVQSRAPFQCRFGIEVDTLPMMFYQYLPVQIPEESLFLRVPQELERFRYLIEFAISREDRYLDYAYLTVKKLFIKKGSNLNREGWHIDGFLTEDVNWVWMDTTPTEFSFGDFNLDEDHTTSMIQMGEQMKGKGILKSRLAPIKSAIRFDNQLVHRTGLAREDHVRTFVKVSLSKHKYNLLGNAHNHLFDYNWDMQPRQSERNNPFKI